MSEQEPSRSSGERPPWARDVEGPPSVSVDFEAVYDHAPPWDIGRPQPALAELAEAGAWRGRLLDVGCGTGEHALLAAGLGLDAMGVDSSRAAIAGARAKAAERGLDVPFEVVDALDLAAGLGERTFDTVVDSALYHVFTDEERARYVSSLSAVTGAGARLFLLCFSDEVPPGPGPRRVSQAELRASFADGWRVDAIDRVQLIVTGPFSDIAAWRAAFTRQS